MLNDGFANMAFHEAGHAVAAYRVGFACSKITINPDGSGAALIDYRDDTALAISILYNLPLDTVVADAEQRTVALVPKICFILLAGLMSEHILNSGKEHAELASLPHEGTDWLKVSDIGRRFHLDLGKTIDQLYKILIEENSQTLIKTIVYHLIDKQKPVLSGYEIDSIVHFSGFKEFQYSKHG